jgi:hypothetical protein
VWNSQRKRKGEALLKRIGGEGESEGKNEDKDA